MSKPAQPDEIDELVSSVRDFVSHKEPQRSRESKAADRLVLTAEQLVVDEVVVEEPIFIEESDEIEPSNVLVLDTKKKSETVNLEATIAELEAAVTAQSDDWEPDEGESFEQSAWAESAFPSAENDSPIEDENAESAGPELVEVPTESDLEAEELFADPVPELEAEPAPEPELEQKAETLVATEVQENGLDEEAIRALVLDIVHEELSGELGERITRNVRKLVRREINRVLASRDMGQN